MVVPLSSADGQRAAVQTHALQMASSSASTKRRRLYGRTECGNQFVTSTTTSLMSESSCAASTRAYSPEPVAATTGTGRPTGSPSPRCRGTGWPGFSRKQAGGNLCRSPRASGRWCWTGRWWLDATCGAISADPFSDRPELCFVELPRGSVLPAAAPHRRRGRLCVTSKHRRLCVSQGRLRYIEVSQEEPFVLSCFVLDNNGTGWTLEHRLDLSRYETHRYGHPWLPLKGDNTPQVGFLDPLTANVVYMSACITTLEGTPRVVFVVDMKIDLPFRSYAYRSGEPCFVPCVLPPWLGSSQIPSAGNKGVKKNKSLADVLVRADNLQKR
ncbi:uncharacterized protein [Triticum aestivum]|uniref:uncharacterized protein n=1 Tax=Triticum aestivum TaxID=4565 RepID=UPI001D00525D|nr:uncharacterized protein LOC123190000 [Triticum aestivum]